MKLNLEKYYNLYPPFKEILLKFEEEFYKKTGLYIYLFSGYRTFEEQQELYNKGRLNTNELIITNAQAGESYHNYTIASDYVFDLYPEKNYIHWSWDNKFPWNEIGIISKKFDIEWGGNFSFIDKPHLQKTWSLDIKKLLLIYKEGGIEKVWKTLDKERGNKYVEVTGFQDNNKSINNKENIENNKSERQDDENNEKNNNPINIFIKIIKKIMELINAPKK